MYRLDHQKDDHFSLSQKLECYDKYIRGIHRVKIIKHAIIFRIIFDIRRSRKIRTKVNLYPIVLIFISTCINIHTQSYKLTIESIHL